MSRHHNTRDDQGRERFGFPSHIRRDGSAVYPPLPGDAPYQERDPRTGATRLDALKGSRQCIACGAQVPAGKPEVCPHE